MCTVQVPENIQTPTMARILPIFELKTNKNKYDGGVQDGSHLSHDNSIDV